MQGFSAWTPPGGTLGGIVAEARQRADALVSQRSELKARIGEVAHIPPFAAGLRRDRVGVIAEVKRRSPSKGWIKPDLSASTQAEAYEAGGAAAISVLTEPAHFGGSIDDLVAVRSAVSIPVLKKDFHVDVVQLLEARALGASAALLIARALHPDDLHRMVAFASEIGLEVLVEVRDEAELARSLEAGATTIGINNRNLETLVIDPGTAERLLSAIPPSAVSIAESGVQSTADVERYARAGADAVLVGSAVSASEDPTLAVRALASVPRVERGR